MGFVDMISAEDRVSVKFSDFYEMMKGCAEREVIANGLRYKIPHTHIQAMIGELPEAPADETAKGYKLLKIPSGVMDEVAANMVRHANEEASDDV